MHLSVDCRLALYADDSALIFSHSDPNFIAGRLSHELSSCKKWLTDNKLSLHVGKTESILFGTSKRLKRVRDFQVTCDGKAVGRVSTVKYLGAKLDEDFKFKSHVTELINKCAGRISFLYRNSSLLDFNCRKIMCNALVQPYLDYCCSSWYSSLTERLRTRLDVLQRRMVKFIFSKDMLYHVSPEDLRKLSWLSIPDRVKYFKLLHVFKIRHGKAPGYMQGNFVPISQGHSHNTRNSSYNYRISREIANAPSSFSFTSIKHWNSLPSFLKELNSEKLFKSRLKEHMFSDY